MKRIIAATLVVPVLMAIGCLVACHSFSTLQGPIEDNRVKGLIYYLPRGQIRIAGDFKSGGGGGTGGPVAKSPGSSAGLQPLVAAPDGSPGGDSAEQKNFVITIAADIEADPSARYYLKPVRNYFYNDDIRLAVNAKHLLSTGSATAEDQTAQIISTTASLAAQAAGIPTPAFRAEEKERPLPEITVGELLHQIEEALSDKKISLDTKIKASKSELDKLKGALPKLDALPKFPVEKKQKIDITLAYLSVKEDHSFTLRNIWDLLWLLVPEASDEMIKPQNAPEVFRKLYAELDPKTPRTKAIQPKPFSLAFDPARAFYRGQPCNISDGKGNTGLPRTIVLPDKIDGLEITVTEELQPEIALLKEIWQQKNVGPTKNNVAYGIAFRALKPYRVRVKSVEGTYFYINESQLVLLPDTCPEHTLVLDYSRLAFVKKTTNVVFVDGVPQSLAQTAPSSVLGFLAIPKGIIQAIVPLSPGITGPPSGVQAPGTSGTTAAPQSPPPSSAPSGS